MVNNRETLARYLTDDGEHIRVVTGEITRTGTTDIPRDGENYLQNDVGRRFTEHSTEIYVNGTLQQVFRPEEIRQTNIPAIRNVVNEAARARVSYGELVVMINRKIFEIADSEEEELEAMGADPWEAEKILDDHSWLNYSISSYEHPFAETESQSPPYSKHYRS